VGVANFVLKQLIFMEMKPSLDFISSLPNLFGIKGFAAAAENAKLKCHYFFEKWGSAPKFINTIMKLCSSYTWFRVSKK
jgi:hypothetical protein